MATNVVIPLEIIEDILYRLPPKALGRSKCVSKKWRTLISSPLFVNTQRIYSNRLNREKVILVSDDNSLYSVDLIDLKNDIISELVATEIRLPQPVYGLGSSCNGLITAYVDEDDDNLDLLFINPTIGESTQVYKAFELLPQDHRIDEVEMFGFGYDSSTDDYKFFSIIRCCVGNVEGNQVRLVVLHSLRSNTLRTDITPPDYRSSCWNLKIVCLNGCIHWLSTRSDMRSFIAGFNFQKEEFLEMELPSYAITGRAMTIGQLNVVSGFLCFEASLNHSSIGFHGFEANSSIELWVMKEYGIRESWKKISINGLKLDKFYIRPLYLLGDGEVVLKITSRHDKMVVYNVEEQTIREVTISGIPTDFFIWGTCVESLVCLTHVRHQWASLKRI